MANKTCWSDILACRVRAARADDVGNAMPGANNLYVTDALIQVQQALEIEEGASIRLRNGCGDLCVAYEGLDEIVGVDLTMEMCVLDAEFIEMLTGAALITDGEDTIGFHFPASGATNNGVLLELWSQRWSGRSGDAEYKYWHRAYGLVKFRLGESTVQNDASRVQLIGKGYENPQAGDGPANDWPEDVETLYSIWADNEIPEANCGYLSTIAQS